MKISCPICHREVAWEGNRFRPFCSERCKLVDLGNWAAEAYRVPSKPDEEEEGRSEESAGAEEERPSDPSSDGKQNGKPGPS